MGHPQRQFINSVALTFLMMQAALLWAAPTPAEIAGIWTSLLAQHVSTSMTNGIRLNAVDYRGMGTDPAYHILLDKLGDPNLIVPSSGSAAMAFWINVYNIGAIRTVIHHRPKESIRDIGNFLFPVWKKDAIQVAGRWYSLDEIENRILRPMGDPRIHMAIVCASVSCPDLRKEAYRGPVLGQQLDEQVRRFLNNRGKGLNLESGSIQVSRIFKWFREDFQAIGGVQAFLRKYRTLPPGNDINYLAYHWSLNDLPAQTRKGVEQTK